jgi:hypothetical protein
VGVDDAHQRVEVDSDTGVSSGGSEASVGFEGSDVSDVSANSNGLHDVPDVFNIRLRKLQGASEGSTGAFAAQRLGEASDEEVSEDETFDFAGMCGKQGMLAYTGHCGYDSLPK